MAPIFWECSQIDDLYKDSVCGDTINSITNKCTSKVAAITALIAPSTTSKVLEISHSITVHPRNIPLPKFGIPVSFRNSFPW